MWWRQLSAGRSARRRSPWRSAHRQARGARHPRSDDVERAPGRCSARSRTSTGWPARRLETRASTIAPRSTSSLSACRARCPAWWTSAASRTRRSSSNGRTCAPQGRLPRTASPRDACWRRAYALHKSSRAGLLACNDPCEGGPELHWAWKAMPSERARRWRGWRSESGYKTARRRL